MVRPVAVSIVGNGPVEYGVGGPGDHMPRCSLWASVRPAKAWERPLPAASSMMARKWAADRAAAEAGLLCHRSSPETAEPGNRRQQSERNCD